MNWNWWKQYIFNFDVIVGIIIFLVVIYFIITIKKRKYKFKLPTKAEIDSGNGYSFEPRKHKKKKRKKNKNEEECRRIFQNIFGVPFTSIRPDFLKNPATGKNLELDGYNEQLKIAFEYDGAQHAKLVPHFHKGGVDEFEYQVKKDSWKDAKCKEKGILLIRIPHFVVFHDLERYIRMILKNKGVDVTSNDLSMGRNKSSFNTMNTSNMYKSVSGGMYS